jgi:hypothetical protein
MLKVPCSYMSFLNFLTSLNMLKTLTNHKFKFKFEFVPSVIRFLQFYFPSEIYDFKSFIQYMRFTSRIH